MVKSGNYDVVVVGAGIFGLHCAWFCADAGLRTLVLDQGLPGSGASGGLVGAMSPHLPRSWTEKKQFQLDALTSAEQHWAHIEDVSGLPTGYGRVGRWMPLDSERVLANARGQEQAATESWAGEYQWTVGPVPPWMSPEVAPHGAVFETLSARIDPRKALASLAEAVRRKGAEMRPDTRIVGVENGAVATVTEKYHATHIILAAGAGADSLHAQVVAGAMGRGVKGQAAFLTDPGGLPGQMVFASGLYIVPHGNGLVAVGSTSEQEWTDDRGTDEQLDDLIAQAIAVCPCLANSNVVERWAGVRPRAPRPEVLLGPVPGKENIWFANGGYKIGIGISHRVGLLTAQMILGQDVRLPERYTAESHGLAAL